MPSEKTARFLPKTSAKKTPTGAFQLKTKGKYSGGNSRPRMNIESGEIINLLRKAASNFSGKNWKILVLFRFLPM